MADSWQRYLAQQMDLGGGEIILPEGSGGSAPAGPAATDNENVEMVMGKSSEPPIQRGRAGTPAWKRGAPPIPGAGLRVDPPSPDLTGDRLADLDSLDGVAERIRTTYCCQTLCPNRKNAVPGEGNPKARLMLIGEGPGATEDASGRPFVGQAGQLLNSILEAIGLQREDVFITNIVKCRPPQNRKPLPDEIAACMPYLHRQIALLRPKVIVALGGTAGEALLAVRKSLGELRGRVHSYGGIPLIVTYHPAALLRNPNWKKPTWDDIRIARQLLDR